MKQTLLMAALALTLGMNSLSVKAADSFAVDAFNRASERGNSALKAKNYDRAFEYLLEASEMGNKKSQYQLALLYMEGLGVKQDYVSAYIWLNVATEVKHKEWQKVKDMLHNAFSEKDLQTLAPIVEEYIEKYGKVAQEVSCNKREGKGSHRKFMQCSKYLTPGL